MSESEDLDSLKVTDLQTALKKRGLDTRGRKADLITRLRQAMNNGDEGDLNWPRKELSINIVLLYFSCRNSKYRDRA